MNPIKRFDPRNTLLIMLRHPQLMYQIIEVLDAQQGLLSEAQYLSLVQQYLKGITESREHGELVLAMHLDNLLFAGVVHDKIEQAEGQYILFNEAVLTVFRLCQLSLVKPLTKQALKTSMAPFWQIYDDLLANRLSTDVGSPDYADWTQDLTQRLGAIFGQVVASVKKLKRIGSEFAVSMNDEARDFAVVQAQYQLAKSIYQREIEPLAVFLDKQTVYENGKGIYGICEVVAKKLQSIEAQAPNAKACQQIWDFQIKFLSLIPDITAVKHHISLYLQKTKTDIERHHAIETAYQILLDAVGVTNEAKQNLVYVNLTSLTKLGPHHRLARRFIPQSLRLPNQPSVIANALGSIARLADTPPETLAGEFQEELDTQAQMREARARAIAQWAVQQSWPVGTDYVPEIVVKLAHSEFADVHITDVFDIAMIIRQQSESVIEFYHTKVLTLNGMCYRYRERHIASPAKSAKVMEVSI